MHRSIEAGRNEGACSRSTLLQHAPGTKLPRPLHQRFLAKKYVQQSFCSRVLNWFDMRESKLQGQICCTNLFQEQAPSCALKFACREMTCLQLGNQIGLFFHSELFTALLGYLPGSKFQEQAPSCVPAFTL